MRHLQLKHHLLRMKKSNWIVPGLIIVGIALIFFSTWAPQNKLQLGSSKKYIATVIEKKGLAKVQNSEMPVAADINANYKLENRDILRTDVESEVLVEFNNGGQFRIAEKSEVLVDKLNNGAPVAIIRTGEIFIEKFGKAPSFWVRSEGQLYSAIDYTLSDNNKSSRLHEPLPEKLDSEQISQIEIETLLNSKKNDFFRCYGQLIQKSPQAAGLVLISFTIQNQGNTMNVEITKSDIADLSFKSCLIEVVARTHFRSFRGNPVATIFPLKFE